MGSGSLSMVKLVCFDVFFYDFICFLGVCFWGRGAYFPYLVGSVELFVVFFVFSLKYIGCLRNQISSKNNLLWNSGYLIIIVVMIACFLFSIISLIYRGSVWVCTIRNVTFE